MEEGLRVVSDPAQPTPADLEVVYYVYDEDDQLVAKVSTFSFQAGGGWAADSVTECRDGD